MAVVDWNPGVPSSGLFFKASHCPPLSEGEESDIYDPQRGMRAKMTAEFKEDGKLEISGSVLLISESVLWEKIEK